MKIKSIYKGICYTVIASLFWGVPQPLFFNEIKFIPPIEVISHRSIWAFIFLLITVLGLGKINKFILLFKSYKKLLVLSITAILISSNWIGFILAVNINRVQDASMGYYISPMISIALGYFFLNEKMSYLKLLSILMMLCSLIFLLVNLKTIPLLAILIGTTWAVYGLLRKQVDVSSEIGLLYESGFISLLAAPYIIYLGFENNGFFLNHTNKTSIFLILTGAVTIFPLFFFNIGIKYIPLGFVGVIFYLTPTFHFFTSIFLLNESLNIYKQISFIIIWIAIGIFLIDKYLEDRKLS